MADIDIKQPAKINRNTAADGDFLWEKDFKVLYENDEKLKNAIQQATQDYTAGDGIDIDPSTKTISVKTGTGIEKTEEGLSVNIEGVDGVNVRLDGNTFKVSAYDSEQVISVLSDNVGEIQNELVAFEQEVEEKYITSGNEMVPNHQYVYTTSGWADIGGEHATVSYWRPTYNESTGKLSWQMSPSIETPDDALVKGDKGDDGKTPEFRINQSTNFWEWKYTDEQNWTSTNTSATGPQGAKGEQGDQGYTPEITHAVDTANSGIKVTISWPAASQIPEENFIIPSGAPGTNGTPGTNGITPKLRVDSSTNRWQVSYDNGSSYTDISPATSATGPKGDKGPEPTIQAKVLDPTSEHTQGGVEWTIKYPGMDVSAIGQIWNGNNGTATVNCDGTWITGNGTAGNVIRPTTETLDILQSVSGKVNKPNTSLTDKYLVLRTDTNGAVSGWCDYNDKIYSKTESDGRYVKKSGDTMSGQLVVNTTTNHPFVGISQRGNTDDFAVFGATRKKSNNNFGTTWLGVGSEGQGVLKNIPNTSTSASTEPESNGAYTQITFGQNNNAVPSIDINAKLNGSDHNYKSVVVPQQSYNNMSAFDATNGPNYMLRKLSDGSFDIGACVINVTSIPQTTEANTYYFVYDV